MVSNISFTSKINFVDANTFCNLCQGERILYSKFVKADKFNTLALRNCTGSIAVDYKNNVAKGAHTYPNNLNFEFADTLMSKFFSDIKAQKGFLIGGRYLEDEQISMGIFEKFKKAFKKKVKDLTVFGGQVFPYSETDFAYNVNTDTLTLCTMFKRPMEIFEHYVSNIDELKECFHEIKIAKGDELFINGEKVELNKHVKI